MFRRLKTQNLSKLLGPAFRGHADVAGMGQSPMKVNADAYSEGVASLVYKGPFNFVIDEPEKLGGQGLGPNPLTYFLGSLMGCTHYTLSMIFSERQLPRVKGAQWSAQAEYDLQGVRGVEGISAKFQKIRLHGIVDTEIGQEDLEKIAQDLERRCIVAATCSASNSNTTISLAKGDVDHECKPACKLHDIQGNEKVTGLTSGQSRRQADTPYQPEQPSAHKAFSNRSYHSSSCFFIGANDGEDVARKNLGDQDEPQIQPGTSNQGAKETAGGAYASRDSPRAQAAQPTEGKSNGDIVKEQVAGASTGNKDEHNSGGPDDDNSSFVGKNL